MPSWDLFIGLFFVVGIGYGLVLQRDRSVTTLLSAYVALIVAQTWAVPISDFLNGNKAILNVYIAGRVSPFGITAGLFVVFIILLAQKSGMRSGRSSNMGSFEILLFSFFSTAIIIATILSFMPADQLANILAQSKLATMLTRFHTPLIIVPPMAVIFFGIRRGE